MTKSDSKCDNCGNLTTDGKHWHTGHWLCNDCFDKWDKKDKRRIEDFRKEVVGESLVKEEKVQKKKDKQMKLF